MKKLKALKNKKGFTLIELLTVIAILGILVLLAAPKFLGYTAQANEVRAKSDIKTFETAIASKLALDQGITENWPPIGKTELESYRDNGSLFTLEGPVEKDYQFNESYVDIPEEDFKKEFKSKLSGNFIMDSGGKIYYHDENLTMGNDKNDSVNNNDENTVVEEPEFTSEEHFTWKASSSGYFTAENPTERGYYQYTGTGEEVVNIPHVINGTEMTSYYRMFQSTSGPDVKKVISTNPDVKDMSYMFSSSQVTSLDLNSFDTSNVTDMSFMFSYSQATSLDLSSFDTSSVTDMKSMFSGSKATSLDLSSFDTSKITDMNTMFSGSQATSLNLSSFDTSSVTNMNWMFQYSELTVLDLSSFDTSRASVSNMFNSSAGLVGYARTQADADKLNATAYKPSTLTFITK